MGANRKAARAGVLFTATLAAAGIMTGSNQIAGAQTTIIQSNTGVGCSSVCINGKCTSTCDDENAEALTGNGDVVEKAIDLQGFTEVVSSDIDTTVSHGKKFSVKVIADSNLVEHVDVTTQGETLQVRLKDGQYQGATMKVEIVMPDLRLVNQRGAADIRFHGFNQSNLEVQMAGAGQVTGDDNKVTNLLVKSTGTGVLDMQGSELTNAEVHATGTSQITLNFANNKGALSGQLDGVSSLQFCGDPANSVSVSGVADMRQVPCS